MTGDSETSSKDLWCLVVHVESLSWVTEHIKILLQCREAGPVEIQTSLQRILLVPKEEVIFNFCDFDLNRSVPSGQKHFILGLSGQQGDSVHSHGPAQCSLARFHTVAIHAHLGLLCSVNSRRKL